VEKYCTAGQTTDDNMAHRIVYLRKATNTLSEYVILDIINFVVAIFLLFFDIKKLPENDPGMIEPCQTFDVSCA
jgi:hypothetical protein